MRAKEIPLVSFMMYYSPCVYAIYLPLDSIDYVPKIIVLLVLDDTQPERFRWVEVGHFRAERRYNVHKSDNDHDKVLGNKHYQ